MKLIKSNSPEALKAGIVTGRGLLSLIVGIVVLTVAVMMLYGNWQDSKAKRIAIEEGAKRDSMRSARIELYWKQMNKIEMKTDTILREIRELYK